ncbi:hypothetical protein [Pelagibius sp. Alg239-R121]|uniref:hypothetical protein n=1 Tax=Pelagibius sp. Alg239-R121 TaxID=2993448 RepID=UPI0024A67539|nr:hypothetical protein [Pelagibius sp. Alg239-R121]
MADFSLTHQRATASNANFDDPSLVIAAAVTAGDRLSAPVEQLVFAWLLSLSPEHDPAVAAGNLLDRYDDTEAEASGEGSKSSTRQLLDLLAEVAAYPRERLSRLKSQRRRRR